jgi:DNA polymerase
MNHRIENGWRICKGIIEDMAAGREGSHGPISWGKEVIYLPNGMTLKYPDLRVRQNDKGYDEWTYQGMLKGTPIRKKIYGGLLCENIVQALARIIVMWQMLQIDKTDRVVMTTHDETVTCVKKARGPGALKAMLKWMRTPLDWCPDIPLNAEGGFDINYSK